MCVIPPKLLAKLHGFHIQDQVKKHTLLCEIWIMTPTDY